MADNHLSRRTVLTSALASTLVVGSSWALAACGGSSDGGGGSTASGGAGESASGGGSTTAVSVGLIPIIDVAPVYLGVEQGIFAKHGLDVTPKLAQGGAAIVPAVLSGENQFGFSNVVSLLIAREKGVKLVTVAAGVSSTGDPNKDVNAVLVAKGSQLQSAKDLAGKKVAVNTLNNIGDTTIKTAVQKDGGDPSKIQFVEIPFPDMPAQLAAGRVDAAWTSEPFVTQIIDAGGRALFDNLTAVDPNLQIAQYFASEQYRSEKPDVVKSFVDAINESMQYATDNPDAVRKILGTYIKIDPATADKVILPKWTGEINRESTQTVGDAAHSFGTLSKDPDVDGLLGG